MRIRSGTGGFLPWLLASALVDWVGTGLFLAVSVLFFVRVAGLSTVAVGSGLTIAALAAMPAVLPVGWLADRYGPRGVLVLVEVIQGAATAGYLAVHGWWSFVAVSFLVAVTQQAAPPLIQALVGDLAVGERRTKILAVHRTVINIGIGTGGLMAGLILGSGMHGAFQVLLVADAVAFVLAAALLCALPGRPGPHLRTAPDRWKALRDRRLLALTGYDALLSLWQPILNVAFPLWLVTRTDAPVGLVGVLYAAAAGCAILLQYPASVLAATPRRALRGYAAAAVCLSVASLGFAAAPAGSGWVTIAIFAGSIVVLTVGEITQVGAAWTLSFAISPAAERTAYLAAFSMGRAFSRAAGPLLMTGVVLALGKFGWIALAAVFAAAALVPVLAARRHAAAPAPARPKEIVKPQFPGTADARLALAIERHRSPDRPPVFTLFDREWDLLPDVYAPVYASSTRLFTQWLPYPGGGAMLEIGCGAGVTAVTAALSGCRRVVAVDINPAAVENTRLNTMRHGVAERVRVLESDMYDALGPADTFDLIFWNSNFAEAPAGTAYDSGLARAFFDPGYACHERYLAGAHRHLRPHGRLLLGFADLGNRDRLEEMARRYRYRIGTLTDERRATASGRTVTFQLLAFAALHPTPHDAGPSRST
jgi:MFS family permease